MGGLNEATSSICLSREVLHLWTYVPRPGLRVHAKLHGQHWFAELHGVQHHWTRRVVGMSSNSIYTVALNILCLGFAFSPEVAPIGSNLNEVNA